MGVIQFLIVKLIKQFSANFYFKQFNVFIQFNLVLLKYFKGTLSVKQFSLQ